MAGLVEVSVDDSHVALLRLNRPEARNALSPEMREEIAATLERLDADPEVRCVVIAGSDEFFAAGADIKAMAERPLDAAPDPKGMEFWIRLGAIGAPTIAAVSGYAFGGGCELALACDWRVVAEDAKLGDTHAKFGLRPTWGMSQRLPALVGPARARWLSYTAATFTGAQAAQWGIAALAVPRDGLDAAVDGLVRAVTANSAGSLRAYKDLYRAAERLPLPDGLAYEAATDYPIADTDERVAGFR